MLGLMSYKKRERLEFALSPPPEDTRQEGGHLQTRRQVLTRHQICQHLVLGLPAFRTARNECLLFKPSSLRYFVISSLSYSSKRTDHHSEHTDWGQVRKEKGYP